MIKAIGLSVSFGAIKALSDVTFSIDNDSEICGIIGPNGAGKSTFLSVIAGEINPTEGSIALFGSTIKKLTPEAACHLGIARTFQIPRPFYGLTVEDNVITSGLSAMSLKDSRLKAKELLKLLNIDRYAYATPRFWHFLSAFSFAVCRDIIFRWSPLFSPSVWTCCSVIMIRLPAGIMESAFLCIWSLRAC
ncbi:ATP-binding cassette domain-containing protein [Ferviditalea candida]|uniref:ATP-binding cassette domain-containing protein n=1 Tax=Ferviditalea candida TaxID=3108399 RepID=A0ABU5ZC69_9BACL|nr:ATP-binding cassette domain-containing protein [Paenibacillaceae bacterium T2]